MALSSALRYILVCILGRALLAPGFSLQSFLSHQTLNIPDANRVTTDANINSGVGVVRPVAAAPPVAIVPNVPAVGAAAAGPAAAPGPLGGGSGPLASEAAATPRVWKIDAKFEMTSTEQIFITEYDSSIAGLALTLADRLKWATDTPMSRFAFWFADPQAPPGSDNVLYCESKSTEDKTNSLTARFAGNKNTSYVCEKKTHTMNSTVPASLLQQFSKKRVLTFEVGVFPPSMVFGDERPSIQVAEEVVRSATSGDEPERKLLKTGLWTYKPGLGVKFHGLFPATVAAMPGSSFATARETSLPLGPNPGGQGADALAMPPSGGENPNEKERDAYVANVDEAVHEAKEINDNVRSSLQELKDSLARASAVHSAWMNTKVYQLPEEYAAA